MLGSQITIGCNLTDLQRMELLTKHGTDIQGNDLVILFFSGHGEQCKDQNYLIYIDNQCFVSNTDLFQCQAVSVQVTPNLFIARKPFATIMVLDCCRSSLPDHQHAKGEDDGAKTPKEAFNPLSIKGIADSLANPRKQFMKRSEILSKTFPQI